MTDTRPRFYYANGTSYFFNWGPLMVGLNPLDFNSYYLDFFGLFGLGNKPKVTIGNVAGLDGKTYLWDGNDPFPDLLDTDLWQIKRVPYPASTLFIGPSIEVGVNWIIDDILTTPVGTPFACGGYSQGAAVMSRIYQECRTGRLMDRRHDLRQVITFGNPMREINHTFPGSAYSGGAVDVPNSTTNGHGCFPSLESMNIFEPFVSRFARLQNTESLFWDFTMPNEIISGVGNSADGNRLVNFTKESLRVIPIGVALDLQVLFDLMPRLANSVIAGVTQNAGGQILVTDALTGATTYISGGGHIMYPVYPPPNADGSFTPGAETCYQVAARQLRKVGQQIYDELHPSIPAPITPPTYSWFSNLPVG